MKKEIKIFECGPRDGWQNIGQSISTQIKIDIIEELISCGVSNIELTSFVSPKAIPQMADALEIANYFIGKYPENSFYSLVPNYEGARRAYEVGVRKLTYVISLSESHNKANINRTHSESFEELERIMNKFHDIEINVGIATAFGCPFEGIPTLDNVVQFAKQIASRGITSMYLADTIGIANPRQVRETVSAVMGALPKCDFQVHIHDTRGMGIVNSLAAIESGITSVQTTLGGLGGCPFAPGASGNTATEDLVYMLECMGYSTGIDFNKLVLLSKKQTTLIDGIYSGHHIKISDISKCY